MNSSDTYIVFELAGAAYGVRSEEVQHIDMIEHITRVPNTAPAVEGVVFSRGQVVPALNLRTRSGLPSAEPTPSSRLIFLKVGARVVALMVDAAREFRTIPRDSFRPIDQTLHGIEGNYVQGVASVKDRLVLLLDVAAVLRVDEVAALAAVAESVSPAKS